VGAGIYQRPTILKEIRRSGHCVIEASAGTGKTFAIEHLVVDLVLSGECAVDQILVVTFTEKATAELRIRVRQALERILLGTPDAPVAADMEAVAIDEAGRKRLEEAFRSFDRAPIFTIHGFCHRVLTDFAFQSGTLLELQLTDSRAAFHQAFRAELRDHLAAGQATRVLLERWLNGVEAENSRGKTPDQLEALLFEAYRCHYLDSDDFGARERAALQLLGTYDGEMLERACRNSGLRNAALRNALSAVSNLSDRIAQADGFDADLLDLLSTVEVAPLTKPILKPQQAGFKFPAQARALAHQLDQASLAAKSPHWKLVDLFLPPVAARLERDKREAGLIDYDDMLKLVWTALDGTGGASLSAALRDRFRCALVDEFQDTDDLQWRIFRRLFVEGGAPSRLYVVGDPKQAIYAFRGADLFTYLDARRELTRGKEPVQLLDNFRSTSGLIDACNHIFDQRTPEPVFGDGEIRYEHPARCGRPDRRATDTAGNGIKPVILMRYARPGGNKASVVEVRSAIGRHLAEQLRRVLNEDRITIEETGIEPRRLTARDIFVLTRTRQESAEAGEYLREAGVPFAFYKQEGLFQTSEAYYILDVLRAAAQPHVRSNRLKAWVSPFFDVPLRELALIDEVPAAHPLNERLYEWKAIAEREQFAELFDHMLHDSGLVKRELFLRGSERRLTNYLHIFEILLAAALSRRLALPEIIALLEDYIYERALPEVEEGNTQRLESERDAVSVITVHMSKGLEAGVVALFGGFGRINDTKDLAVYHDEHGHRRFAIGKVPKDATVEQRRKEQNDEDRRLLYVALTRARARLYLPMLPDGSTKKKPDGYYAALNQRLLEIDRARAGDIRSNLFVVQDVAPPPETGAGGADWRDRVKAWTPPSALIDEQKSVQSEGSFWNLRRLHAAPVMRSYTSLRTEEERRWDIPAEEFKGDLETPPDDRDLPGGREVGIFLHEAVEKLPMESFAEPPDLARWRQRDDVAGVFRAAMYRNRVKEPWFERGTEMVFNAMTTEIAVSAGMVVGPLYRCRSVREMEFVYPIPEATHPLLAAPAAGAWNVERGYLKGFVDFVFDSGGLVYFADWKSDQLPSYEPAAIQSHVQLHYGIQARIYSIGVIRLLQIRGEEEYRRRFGGLLYIFLRGIDRGGRRGVYFHRPAWSEICAHEAELMRTQYRS
jgi:exodeoxyribonuclease V beta subunit